MQVLNSAYTTRQTEMANILQTFHSKTEKHALILNSKKGKETQGPTHIMLNHI